MSRTVAPSHSILAELAERCGPSGLTSDNAGEIAKELAKTFAVHDDEVAILKIDSGQLRFIWPVNLSTVGMIPLTHTSSVAARTANTRRPEILNNFSQTRHASIFEAVRVESKTRPHLLDRAAMVIQKLISAPVTSETGVVGVMQISRKGATPQSAGPDFVQPDLKKLVDVVSVLAPCF